MKKKYYPFSARLTKKLKEVGAYAQAKAAYDTIESKDDKLIEGKEDGLDGCFVFAKTKEGSDFWWDVHYKIKEK